MYSIYKINNRPRDIKQINLQNLNILRFDVTEQELYNFRELPPPPQLPPNINTNRCQNAPLKKIGFISRDFSENRPSGQLSKLFFELLSKYSCHFTIYFYMLEKHFISNGFKNFAVIRRERTLDKLAARINEDNIDILIDMQGHMHSNFNELLLKKPAPIQMHWLGYPGTTGLSTMDYLIADEVIIPKTSQQYYCEKIAYLPNCYQCNNHNLLQTVSTKTRSDYGIPNGAFVFCHFNSDYKLDRKTWFVWMDILKSVKNSVLLFNTMTDTFKRMLIKDALNCGVPMSQLIHVKRETRADHINKLCLCNLGLDNYRLNGHTTSADLIAAGIPFITYTSETYHNRVAKSILCSLDLEELVCYSFDEYKKLAIKLSTDGEYYNRMRNKVIENREKTLFNTRLYVNNFVNLIHNIWKDNYDPELKTIWQLNEDSVCIEEPLKENNITKFSPIYKCRWTFYSEMDSNGGTIHVTDLRHQRLRDFANAYGKECVAFNLNGEIKNEFSADSLVRGGCGIWVKELITYDAINENAIMNEINKDYNLPLVMLVYIYTNINAELDKIIDFYESQLYLNAGLLVITTTKLTKKLFNVNEYINTDNKCVADIMKELNYDVFIELTASNDYSLNLISETFSIT